MSSRNRRHMLSRLNPFSRKNRKPAATLAATAGGQPEMLEQLEQRQMLFTLTVAAPDPGLDVGTVRAFFSYTIPYLAATVAPGTAAPTAVFEDFDSDDPAGPPVNIPANFIFDQSNLQLAYTVGQLSVARLALEAGAQQGEHEVEFVMQQGESFSFRVPYGTTGAASTTFVRFRNPSTFTMEIGGTFDTNVVTVELRLEGQVVTSLTAGALFAVSTPVAAGVRQYTFAAPPGLAFDEVRFEATGGPTGPFRVDNVGFSVPAGNFGQIVENRIFGATISFTGPVGATFTVLDLYGRDMRLTLALGIPEGSNTQVPIVDPDDDGIPDFNDGIGQIIISGTDRDSAITMWGGTIESFTGQAPPDAEFTQNGFAFLLDPTTTGIYDDFEAAGFGYSVTVQGTQVNVTGLPPAPGSLIIGAPFVRPQNAYNPGGIAGGGGNFNRVDQGIFVLNGAPISSVYVNGIVHGASTFTGYVDRIVTGYNVGSISVAGDLGFFSSGSDAGVWVDDDGRPYVPTGATLTVGRTLGEFAVAGRNFMNITVVGDLNSPGTRPPRDILRYVEQEYPTGQNPPATVLAMIRNILANNNYKAFNRSFVDLGFFFDRAGQALAFGTGTFRNDAILSAEWIGSIGTAAQITGDLQFRDPLNSPDASDVYAFAADGSQEVVFQLDGTRLAGLIDAYMRVVDQDGRTLASPQITAETDEFIGMRFRPTTPGVYYLVVHGSATQNYVINVNGLTPTTFGSYRTGGGSGHNIFAGNTIQVLSGSMGAMRVGTGFVDGTGAEVDPVGVMNVPDAAVDNLDDEADEYMALRGMSVGIPGNLYNITTGSDIQDSRGGGQFFILNVGGNLGNVVTGLSPVTGVGPTEGDFRFVDLTIGGSVGMFDIRGGLGIDQDVTGVPPIDPENSVVIRAGTAVATNPQLKGDIGMIRVGSHAGGSTLSVQTPNGSVLGGFLVSQDLEFDQTSTSIGIYFSTTPTGQQLNLGFNSDVRFFDTPRIDLSAFVNATIALLPGVPAIVTDDAGGQVSIQIVGGNANAGGLIRVIPIGGSLGVAIGRVEVNLDGGAQLLVNSLGPVGSTDLISIGRIVVTGADANSTINVTGQTEVDIWRIIQTGGDAFGGIANSTPRGDIVATDMVALTNLFVAGDIGRTQVPAWGPSLIGPFLGITGQGQTDVGGPIQIPGNVLGGPWNGALYRPVNNSNGNVPPSAWLDDIGGPVNPYLNGVIVRTGNITNVQAGGMIGDVVANDTTVGNGIIANIVANADTISLPGRFEGIVGTIYANIILSVDIGNGLAQKTSAPLPTTGIFANDDIGQIFGTRITGAFISSVIAAANNVVGNAAGGTDGINAINLIGGGDFVEAYVTATTLDSYWTSFYTFDGAQYRGDINQFTGTTANFIRSEMVAVNIRNFQLTGGFYDASQTTAAGNIDRMIAVGYRNSTLSGGDLEFFPNTITVAGNILLLTTFNRAGDIDDLVVDALGRILEISARNISRTQLDADLEIRLIQTVGDLRAVTITAGLLSQAIIGQNVRSTQISISGPIVNMTVAGAATNTNIDISGPDGRLDRLQVRQQFTGSIAVAGPIGTIEVIEGDFVARLLTVVNLRGVPGNVALISAGRDIDIDAEIGGTITRIAAGRHLGNRDNPRPIVVHGDVFQIDVRNGQMYSDFRIDQRLTGSLLIGAVANKPGSNLLGAGALIAFGRIESVVISGDFAGKIISYSGSINNVTINNGSLLKGGLIQAFDGDINSVVINSGHLFGDIHADFILYLVQVNASADGVFGDLGINPALSQGISFDGLRNQLPPGVVADSSIQGPRITAGFNIGRITLTNGSIFEAFIHAGRAIGTIDVNGDIRNDTQTFGTGTVIAAGSSIFLVNATGNMSDLIVIAGARSFGNDGRPGGVGLNADTIQSGRIESITSGGSGTNVIVTAGMNSGADGIYNTGDETVVLGISFVRTVTFAAGVSNATVFADSPTLTVSPGVVRAGSAFPLADPDLSDGSPVIGGQITPGVPFLFNLPGGIQGSITFTGPGQAYFDINTRKVILVSTSLASTLLVQANGTLTDFDIVTNDDASMGSITVTAPLAGDSDIVVDAYSLSIAVGDFAGTGSIRVGMNVRTISTGNFSGGFIQAAYWARDIIINGGFGSTSVTGEARIDVNSGNSITINGTFAALVNVERELGAFTVNGAVVLGQFRAGGSVGAFTTGAMSQSRVSIGDNFGAIVINGDVIESNIQAGGDLGADAAPGGTGFEVDRVSTGSIGSVRITGNFLRSSLTAGMLRGPDGYFGTADDSVAAGRSNIGLVTITGTQVGSNLGSESFRVSATGQVAGVTLGGQVVTQVGNFRVETLATGAIPLRVQDLVISQSSLTWSATFYFNQSVDAATVPTALTIAEVRNGGLTLVPLVLGVDYTLVPSTFKDRIIVQFSRAVTDRNLVPPGNQAPGLPGPGVFRFTLSAATLRATVSDSRLDADPATALADDFSQDTVVGDAGDKLIPEIINNGQGVIADLYGPVDLSVVLDNNLTPDGVPDANRPYIVRGFIGDHPDHGVAGFRVAGDTDIYMITLRAGQILRLGSMKGSALFTGRFLYNANGEIQFGASADTYQLPTDPIATLDFTQPDDYLIKTTGTYYIAVGLFGITDPGILPDETPGVSDTGDYNFSLTVFDDGDTGFAATTDSGNGTPVVDAPQVIVFAGPNQVFQNPGDPGYDDLAEVAIGDYVFTLNPGADGTRGTADDIVSGTNRGEITSTRSGSTLTTVIESAIGPRGHSGVPGDFAADIDVFLLNNGQTIAPGRTITVKIKLAELGADLGSFSSITGADFRGDVQFGIFDVTGATGIDDGVLLASPSDFRSIAQSERVIAQQGPITYGFDANGDFYLTFVTSGRIGGLSTDPAAYAVYLQGVFNTDYTIEITQNEATPVATIPQNRQNVFIETRGGTVDWLQAGGLTTTLAPFSAAVLGFTGTALSGQNVGDYILTNLVNVLNGIFLSNGLNVVFSTDPNAFEFQPFSTVFLSATTDPITIFNTDNFGYSQHSDPFNADLNDEAAIFLPSFAQLGYTPAQSDLDNFVLSLTAAVGRRVGELTGLRIEANASAFTDPVNIMGANRVFRIDGQSTNYAYSNVARALSTEFDSVVNTNFFLGQQNAFALLDKFLTP